MTEVRSEMCGDEKFWIVTHTRADDGSIALPLFTDDGEKYVPDANDVFELKPTMSRKRLMRSSRIWPG